MGNELKRITLEVSGPVARITLNNPPLNVIDLVMMNELAAALIELERHAEIMAVVIAGSERAFSSGVDVEAHGPQTAEEMLSGFHRVIRTLAKTRKVTIASVRRHCLGGGAELALLCDMIYASDDAIFGFPEIKLAAFPPVAMVALSAVIGQKRAAEMVLTGRTLSAKEALEMGLVNGVAADPEGLVTETLDRIRQLSPSALAIAKTAFYAWDAIHFERGLDLAEQIYLKELMKTEDAMEGIRAYMEKRRPRWTGK